MYKKCEEGSLVYIKHMISCGTFNTKPCVVTTIIQKLVLLNSVSANKGTKREQDREPVNPNLKYCAKSRFVRKSRVKLLPFIIIKP